MNIGEIIKELRITKGLKQKEVAESLTLSSTTYNRYENDIRQPDYDTLLNIAQFFGVDISYFFEEVLPSSELTLLRIYFKEYIVIAKELHNLSKQIILFAYEDIGTKDFSLYKEKLNMVYLALEKKRVEIQALFQFGSFESYLEELLKSLDQREW